MQHKPKILVMSDHSSLHTGFATVSRNIINYLYDTGKYEIRELGWFAPSPSSEREEKPRWKIYNTDTRSFELHERDKYGVDSLPKVLADFEPAVVFAIGDEWMIKHANNYRDKFNYRTVLYSPIDSRPHPIEWATTFANADIMVAYCEWGKKSMQQRNPGLNPIFIWHGVESDVFKPFDETERQKIKQEYGFNNRFIIGCVARNQPRKQIPLLYKAMAYLVHPKMMCPDTHKCYICDPDMIYINELLYIPREIPFIELTRKNPYISPFTGKICSCAIPRMSPDEIGLYLHMAIVDVGWDLHELNNRYQLVKSANGIGNYVIFNDKLKVGKGVSTSELSKIYNAMDVFALPTNSEGWGLPISEAMSCGVPVIVTNYSAYTDFAPCGGLMVDVQCFVTDPRTNLERAIADPIDMAQKIKRFINDPMLRDRYGTTGRAMAEKMDWKKYICPRWEEVMDQAIKMQQDGRPYHLDYYAKRSVSQLEVM